MAYKKATEVLPTHLLEQVQRYINGELLYIPKPESQKIGWGRLSGAREQIRSRNEAMIYAYQSGKTVGEIAREYFLSEDTIRKIVYGKNDYTNTRSNIAN